MSPRIVGLVALTMLAASQGSEAQDPGVRTELKQFRASLAAVSDSLLLRHMERQLSAAGATAETEALRRLRRGHVRLRIGETGDGPSYSRAAGDFKKATELEPGWSDAWEARGLALRGAAAWQTSDRLNLGSRVGFGSLEAAVASFARAVEQNPANGTAARALYEGAVLLGDTARFADLVLPTLRRAAAAGSPDTSLCMALGRAERLMGDPREAIAAFRCYLAQGGNPGIGQRDLAWSEFLAGDPTADSTYYAAAALEDSAGILGLRQDLELIAERQSLMEFDQARGAGRAAFLRRFWSDRDRQALRPSGDRLREHYRRITAAERRYGLEVNRRHFSATDVYRSGSGRFDDRGIVYIRHGEPDQRVSTITFGIQPNETWFYHQADGNLLLHFAANPGGDIRDYRLIPSVTAIQGVDGSRPGDAATFFAFNDRCVLYLPYCRYLGWGPFGQRRVLEDERALVRASDQLAVTTDGYALRFPHQPEVAVAAFVVGREGDQQLLHVVYRVAQQLPEGPRKSRVPRAPGWVRVNLFDAGGHSVAWLDTVVAIPHPDRDRQGQRDSGVDRVQLAVPSGRWRYQVAVAFDDSIGQVLPTDSLSVGYFDGSRLAVSDLVLSGGRLGTPWVPAAGDTAYFDPENRWARSDTIALYHEIYGLTAGAPFEARLLVRRSRKVVLAFSWRGEATGEVTRVSRTLLLASLRPGPYRLEIEVIDSHGATAHAGRQIEIAE